MIAMKVVLKVRPEKKEEFLQAIHSLNSDQEKHKGLKRSTLYPEMENQTDFSLIYEWETQEDLNRYLGAEKFEVLLGALKVLGEKSEIRYGISEEWGNLAHSCEPRCALRPGSE